LHSRKDERIVQNMSKPNVAFICVHNSCRSQIAEALGKHLAAEVFNSYSACTEIKQKINQDAVRLMKQIYGIDMEQRQHSKLLNELPKMNIVVKMGCDVGCPFLPGQHVEDWGLDDPTGRSDAVFRQTIQTIHDKVLALREAVESGRLPLCQP
jgi:arsenate reductase